MANERHSDPPDDLRPNSGGGSNPVGGASPGGGSTVDGGVNGVDEEVPPGVDKPKSEPRAGMGTAPIRGGKSRVDDGSALGGPESVDEGWDDEPGLADTVDASSTVDELVVYLDGYLDAEARRRVEQRLLGDDDARAELAALQNSWDALDCLPATACSAEFTESTMKLVVQNELAAVKPGKWAQKTLLVLGLAAAAVISLAVGFFAAQSWQLAEERRFLEEFELIRDWEKYQLIGDFEFLLDLEREGLFAQEVSHEER